MLFRFSISELTYSHAAEKAAAFGLESEGKADMEKVLEYIHQKQDPIRNGENAEALRKNRIDAIVDPMKTQIYLCG